MATERRSKLGQIFFRNLGIAVGLILLYAFAVQVTDISMETLRNPARQDQVIGVLRFLGDPNLTDPDLLDAAVDSDSGPLELTDTSRDTVRLIVETIFMALMATTIGTILAVPVSFLAARNLMVEITMPLASIMLGVIAFAVGTGLTWLATSRLLAISDDLGNSLMFDLVGLGVVSGAVWLAWRVGTIDPGRVRQAETRMLLEIGRLVAIALLAVLGLGLVASAGAQSGQWISEQLSNAGILSVFSFVGNFIEVISDAIRLLLAPALALIGGLISTATGSRYGQELVLSITGLPARLLSALLTVGGAALLVFGVGSSLNWLYQFDNPQNWTTIPAAAAGIGAGLLSLLLAPKRPFAVGALIYAVSRGILNVLRSIEPLIMAVVFVVWVGLGPFAGVMALTLHTIAALGKLFSEQIEGISEGPIEAVTATGANRLQTIFFAVIPQIIPPYIAYTLYRWDINVRLSTIIGFVGGGGIGFLLSQSTRLLRYRDASVMMLAIAVVVSALDYVSSRIRTRII